MERNDDTGVQARIVRYWRAVEYFSPPKVDRVDPNKGVRAVHDGKPLPWDPGELPRSGSKYVWRHRVYAGVFDIAKVREVLLNLLHSPEAEAEFGSRAGGDTALLSFSVD